MLLMTIQYLSDFVFGNTGKRIGWVKLQGQLAQWDLAPIKTSLTHTGDQARVITVLELMMTLLPRIK